MSNTITVRLDASLRNALERRAASTGTTISEVIRETLRDALDERPLAQRIGNLRGTVRIERSDDPWRARLRERNWRS